MSEANLAGSNYLPVTAGGTVAQYRMVEGTKASATAADAIADVCIGSSVNSAVSGEQLSLQIAGVAKVTASAAITAGAEVMVTASGAGKVSTSSGATANSVGIAMTAALADGDIIEVLLHVPNVKGAANS